MKKIPLLFLSLVFGTIFASGGFDYELIRTPEVPGFFMTKIFSAGDNIPLKNKEIFVKNFAENKEENYRELFPFLQQERQAKIINLEDYRPEKIDKNDVVISLGKPLENTLNFQHESGDIFNQFQNFAEKNLSPVILNNLKIKFGGNIFDVQTKQEKITPNSPAIFIGKFSKPIKTRMEVSGNTLESQFKLVSSLDLSDKKYTNTDEARYLPEIWSQLADPGKNPAKNSSKWWDFDWMKVLPYLSGIVIFIILFFILRYLFQNREEEEDFSYEEEVPVFHQKITEEEYKKYDTDFEKKDYEDEDLPFEVIWKQ